MAGPKTEFDGDECQALLDAIDKLGRNRGPLWSAEEIAVYRKLVRAGKFYSRAKDDTAKFATKPTP